MDNKLVIRVIALVILISIVSVIAYFTSKPGEESDSTSQRFAVVVEDFVDRYFKIDRTDYFWTDTLNAIIRKIGHFTEFMLLGIAACWFFIMVIKKKGMPYLISLGLCLIIALVDEFRQNFVSGRTPRWFDIKIDLLGSIVGIGFFALVYYLFTKYKTMKLRIQQLEQKINHIQGNKPSVHQES